MTPPPKLNPIQIKSLINAFQLSVLSEDVNEFKDFGAQILKEVGHFETQNNEKKNILHLACIYIAKNSLEKVKYLLENGANPNSVGYLGYTPLHFCISYNGLGDSNIVKDLISLLLEYGADFNIKSKNNNNPQHFAKNLELMKYLIKQNVDLKGKGVDGFNLLHMETMRNSFETVCFLINQGLDVNSTNTFGDTALHIAATNGSLDLVEILINHGAILDFPGQGMETPLFRAYKSGHVEIFKWILASGASLVALDSVGENLFLKNQTPSKEIQSVIEQENLQRSLFNPHSKKQPSRI